LRATRAGQSALLFLDAVEILKREKIDYLVIGAFALAAHAVVRASSDVEALLGVAVSSLAKLAKKFGTLGFTTALRRGEVDDPILGMIVLSDSYGNQVDLLGGLRGLDPKIFSRAVEVPFLGENLRIVGREDFIAMKCFAGGPQDVEDARSVYLNASSPLDLDLLRALTRRFGRDAADKLEQVSAGYPP
jgi:hypothetical protein